MKILFATFDSPEAFLARLDMDGIGDGHAGRLRVATKARYKSRQAVVLEIGFPGLPNRVLLRATAAGEATAADALFEIVPGEEHKRDFLVAVASGKAQASALHRRHRRFPMRLPARFVVDGGQGVPLRGDAETEDVGPSGVFLKTPRSLPEGARVTVVLDPLDGSAELELTGRVVYTRKPGSDEGSEPGVGVQFDKPTTDDRKRLRRMIRDVKVQGRMVQWEDEAASRKASAQKKGEARK